MAFSPDLSEVFFSRCFGAKDAPAHCKLMVSKADGDSWSVPKVLEFVEDEVNYGGPSLSADGNTLYFSSNHPDGWGGHDIYTSERQSDGSWERPVLLSRSINTPGNEMFPSVDNDTLYFASDSHTGMGGLDIFRSYKLSNGSWAPAYNLKAPINSGADDFGFIVDRKSPLPKDILQQGYFTSTRDEGIGGDDIFHFTKVIPPEPPIVEVPQEIEYKLLLEGYVLEKIYNDPYRPQQ